MDMFLANNLKVSRHRENVFVMIESEKCKFSFCYYLGKGENVIAVRKKFIIMAGGKGERFWPYSRSDKPKQFLPVYGKKTLLQQTVERIRKISSMKDIFIVTGQEYMGLVKEQVPEVPEDNILVEPTGRDTAPCIGLGYTYLRNEPVDTVMMVLPADHLVLNEKRFFEVIEVSAEAAFRLRKLITIGIIPTRPETGYGYIRYGSNIDGVGGVKEVITFTEKPNLETALSFLESGEYLWNSGMFTWRLDVINEAYRRYLPQIYVELKKIAEAIGTDEEKRVLGKVFPSLPKISVDYGVLEKSSDVCVVPGDFGWDDLGSWTALERVAQTDENSNCAGKNMVLVDTANSILRSENKDKLVATLGLRNAIVVDTKDVLLVADKSQIANLKVLIDNIKEQGYQRYLVSKEETGSAFVGQEVPLDQLTVQYLNAVLSNSKHVLKPWGKEIWWSVTEEYVGKLIEVKAGQALSLQYHREKKETMLFIKGVGTMELNGDKLPIRSGLVLDIEPGTIHRVKAETDLAFIEISTSQVDDVIRLEDDYGRTGAK